MPERDHLRLMRTQVWEVQRRAGLHCGGGPLADLDAGVRDLATAVDTLLSAEIARASTGAATADREAMDAIQRALSGREWESDTISEVAEIVRRSGREIADVGEDA